MQISLSMPDHRLVSIIYSFWILSSRSRRKIRCQYGVPRSNWMYFGIIHFPTTCIGEIIYYSRIFRYIYVVFKSTNSKCSLKDTIYALFLRHYYVVHSRKEDCFTFTIFTIYPVICEKYQSQYILLPTSTTNDRYIKCSYSPECVVGPVHNQPLDAWKMIFIRSLTCYIRV
jgi:hypothetical protein